MNRIIGYQQDLLGGPEKAIWSSGKPPKPKAPKPTPEERAAQREAEQATHREQIVKAIKEHGPMGKDRMATKLALTSRQISPRLSELQKAGTVRKTTFTERASSGRFESTWELV